MFGKARLVSIFPCNHGFGGIQRESTRDTCSTLHRWPNRWIYLHHWFEHGSWLGQRGFRRECGVLCPVLASWSGKAFTGSRGPRQAFLGACSETSAWGWYCGLSALAWRVSWTPAGIVLGKRSFSEGKWHSESDCRPNLRKTDCFGRYSMAEYLHS